MDPITAIGLASAIITFVEIGSKIAKRLEELSEAGDVPKVFRDVRTRLPLLLQIVERTRDGTRDLNVDSQASLEAVVRNCYEQVKQLEEILDKVTIAQQDSRWKRGAKAVVSLIEENRVQRIATALKDNVQLLTFLNVSLGEKHTPGPEWRRSSIQAPPPYESSTVHFHVPFERDEHFVGRQQELDAINQAFVKQRRVAISGIGGIGKSQIAIEFCYRYKELNPSTSIFWVWGGNAARFELGYKRLAQALDLPGWEDPDVSVLQLVADWLSTSPEPFLLVLDNADNMQDWWPNKYLSNVSGSAASKSLADYLPHCEDIGQTLITSRDSRIALRLAKHSKPIGVQPMSREDARQLFLSKAEGDVDEYPIEEVDALVQALDNIPLAISHAAAFIEENPITISEYLEAIENDDAEEFLEEELHDTRRDQDSFNSIFRTWKLSFDQLQIQKPSAADLLLLLSMLDRQSIPKFLLKGTDEFRRELTTALGTLQSFSLLILRANKASFQLHRLVHRFVQSAARRTGTTDRWRAAALKCVSAAYPVEIGAAEYDLCESLNPHVLTLINHTYSDDNANLDLAHLLCWSADFAIEKNQFSLATERAKRSLDIFQRLVPESDGRRASATWLYGRLLYYEAKSEKDMDTAATILEESLRISSYPTMNYAETAFELAFLYFDLNKEAMSLEMGKASYECWKAIEGPSSKRTLDNLHDYALGLGLFGHEKEAIAKWNEVLALCPSSGDTSDETRKVFELRSLASIAEFSDDPAMAEVLYRQVIQLCGAIYNEHHVHIFDYRLCHSEQVLRQGRCKEAAELGRSIFESCQQGSEWQVRASSLQIMAECCKLQHDLTGEETQRHAIVQLHERILGRSHAATIAAVEACSHCYMRNGKLTAANALWLEVVAWRNSKLGHTHTDTVRAVECQGICAVAQGRYEDAEALFLEALGRQAIADPRLLGNLCVALEKQGKWDALEVKSRQALQICRAGNDGRDENLQLTDEQVALEALVTALEHQDKMDEALSLRARNFDTEQTELSAKSMRGVCVEPPLPLPRRLGRKIHPRTWSA